MFNLEQAVSTWRKQMLAQGIKSPAILDELESHLRDEVDAQVRLGVDCAEAFKIAVQQMGRGSILKAEFAKVGKRVSHLPLIFRVSCFVSAPLIALANVWALLDSPISPDRALAMFAVTCMALYTGSLPFWYRRLPNPYRNPAAISIRALSLLAALFPVFALLDAYHAFHIDIGIALTMAMWSGLTTLSITIFAYMSLDVERGIGWGLMDCPPTDKFTDLAQHGIQLAYDEAAALGHDYVGTEHLLLGIASSESGLLMDVLRKWNTDADQIRREIEKMVGPGVLRKSGRDVPYTPRAKKALALALNECRSMGHSFISAEHIFLGLLLEKEGVAGIVLRNLGINAARARRDILDGMGPDDDSGPQPVLA